MGRGEQRRGGSGGLLFDVALCLIVLSSTEITSGWMGGWHAILCPFQQYFSHIRTMEG